MRAALLCNGPSKHKFDLEDKTKYNYILGCNIPWTKVDATVIMDIEVVKFLAKNANLIKCPILFSRQSWREIHRYERSLFVENFAGLVDPMENENSGHVGLRFLIANGYTNIDIFGCDSYFEFIVDSSTHEFVKSVAPNTDSQITRWRQRWDAIIHGNSNIRIYK